MVGGHDLAGVGGEPEGRAAVAGRRQLRRGRGGRQRGQENARIARAAYPESSRRTTSTIHVELMLEALGEDHALQGRDVGVVPPPGGGDVAVVDELVVRGVDVDPAAPRDPQRRPGMGDVGALQPLLPRRRVCLQVAAHVPGGQSEGAQTADGQVGEVLADAFPGHEHLVDRGGHRCRTGLVVEVGMDPLRQVDERLDHRSPAGGTMAPHSRPSADDAATSGESSEQVDRFPAVLARCRRPVADLLPGLRRRAGRGPPGARPTRRWSSSPSGWCARSGWRRTPPGCRRSRSAPGGRRARDRSPPGSSGRSARRLSRGSRCICP